MEQNSGKGLSIAGLILGICACVLAWFYAINAIAVICGIVGIVCAVKGQKLAKAAGVPTGMATAGLVLSIIGLVLGAIGFLACTVCVICTGNAVNSALSELATYA